MYIWIFGYINLKYVRHSKKKKQDVQTEIPKRYKLPVQETGQTGRQMYTYEKQV